MSDVNSIDLAKTVDINSIDFTTINEFSKEREKYFKTNNDKYKVYANPHGVNCYGILINKLEIKPVVDEGGIKLYDSWKASFCFASKITEKSGEEIDIFYLEKDLKSTSKKKWFPTDRKLTIEFFDCNWVDVTKVSGDPSSYKHGQIVILKGLTVKSSISTSDKYRGVEFINIRAELLEKATILPEDLIESFKHFKIANSSLKITSNEYSETNKSTHYSNKCVTMYYDFPFYEKLKTNKIKPDLLINTNIYGDIVTHILSDQYELSFKTVEGKEQKETSCIKLYTTSVIQSMSDNTRSAVLTEWSYIQEKVFDTFGIYSTDYWKIYGKILLTWSSMILIAKEDIKRTCSCSENQDPDKDKKIFYGGAAIILDKKTLYSKIGIPITKDCFKFLFPNVIPKTEFYSAVRKLDYSNEDVFCLNECEKSFEDLLSLHPGQKYDIRCVVDASYKDSDIDIIKLLTPDEGSMYLYNALDQQEKLPEGWRDKIRKSEKGKKNQYLSDFIITPFTRSRAYFFLIFYEKFKQRSDSSIKHASAFFNVFNPKIDITNTTTTQSDNDNNTTIQSDNDNGKDEQVDDQDEQSIHNKKNDKIKTIIKSKHNVDDKVNEKVKSNINDKVNEKVKSNINDNINEKVKSKSNVDDKVNDKIKSTINDKFDDKSKSVKRSADHVDASKSDSNKKQKGSK